MQRLSTAITAIASAALTTLVCSSAFAGNSSVTPSAASNAFAGPYVGLGVGAVANIIDLKSSTGLKASHGDAGVGLEALLGYDFAIHNKWILGIQADGRFNSNKDIQHKNLKAGGVTAETKMDWQFGVAARLGFVPMPNNMFYVLAGPTWIDFDHSYNSPSSSISFNQLLTGAKVGVGAVQKLSTHLALGEEINASFFEDIDKTNSSGLTVKADPVQIAGLVSLSYIFA